MSLFHGYMYIDLIEAENLPDMDTAFFNVDGKDTSDPYAQVVLGNCVICKSAYINNDTSPKWQESYRIPVCHPAEEIRVMVLDKDHVGGGKIGEVVLSQEEILEGEVIEGWHDLPDYEGARVNFKIQYISKENIDNIFEVPECYFKMQEGGKVTLYQDAHCPESLPFYEFISDHCGTTYKGANAWVDLYNSISQAQHFIYISGWSVCTETVLLRSCECETEGVGETFGQLLVRKAEEGVRVLVLIWNEKMSNDVTPGLMGTHDEETRLFFEGTDVEVAVVPRIRLLEGLTSFLRNQFAQTCYTHHQKTIICDDPLTDEEKPRILAYLGGLDVTNGRWDTPEHDLFRTLKDLHSGDFYNNCVTTTPECGPRQPWHDIHCKLEGPGAKDVLDNFTERWRLQASEKTQRLLHINNENFELEAPLPFECEDMSWNSQIFRSITSDSALFDFDKSYTIPKRKGKFVDDSIHRAYIHHIRRADRFIYIENQYFLGSAFAWDEERDTKAYHLIPQEITQRIIQKINDGADMRVYIIIPMFPEGDPTTKPVQEILHWQHRTMEMMYKCIAKAIEENELETHPTDYLSFFCLGKRESPDKIPEDLSAPEPETTLCSVREQARFMIYVHSKMMIVDDDYIIVGSANINQRSMGGTRDSEIAVGAFQPEHTREATGGEPNGDIHNFRLALWGEHLGTLDDVHIDPGTIECMQAVREAASVYWQEYAANDPKKVEGHLLHYPVQVCSDGTVLNLDECDTIPDLNASILGAPNYLPNKLTT